MKKFGTWLVVVAAATVLAGCGHAAAPSDNMNNMPGMSNGMNMNGVGGNSTGNNVDITTVSNGTDGTDGNSASGNALDANNTSNSTDASGGGVSVNSQQDAANLMTTVYASLAKSDKNMKIAYSSQQQTDGHTVYVFQVYDHMADHDATIGWVWVRDDGMLEDGVMLDGWKTPAQWTAKVEQRSSGN